MAKVSKNQRTDRGRNEGQRNMARIIVAQKNDKGHFSFREKMVEVSEVQNELKAARES